MTTSQEKISRNSFEILVYELTTYEDRKAKREEKELESLTHGTRFTDRKIKVIVDGILYPSMSKAARAFGITSPTVAYRCNSTREKFKNWNFHGSETSTR